MTEPTGLYLQNVHLIVSGPPAYRALDGKGDDLGPTPLGTADDVMELEIFLRQGTWKPISRDWRGLRDRLMSLNLADADAVARWLNDAGYAIRRKQDRHFASEDLTPEILALLGTWKTTMSWAMSPSFQARDLQQKIGETFRYAHDRSDLLSGRIAALTRKKKPLKADALLRHPQLDASFLRRIGAPRELPAGFVDIFLRGFGARESLPARFELDRDGLPIVFAEAETPLIAIALTVYIDRVFTVRQTAKCKECGRLFTKTRKNQSFCPRRNPGITCQTRWKTRFQRDKVRLVKDAALRAPRSNTWGWIANYAARKLRSRYPDERNKKLMTITPEWTKRQSEKERKTR